MSGDKTTNPLNKLPPGWLIEVSFTLDDWPCVQVVLTQNFGRVRHEGHGDADNLDAALAKAVDDVLARLTEAANVAI